MGTDYARSSAGRISWWITRLTASAALLTLGCPTVSSAVTRPTHGPHHRARVQHPHHIRILAAGARRALPAFRSSAVGPLFQGRVGGRHSCTASVVAGGKGDMLITAAHCIRSGDGFRRGLVFAPGYVGGRAPYGVWRVGEMFVPWGWSRRSDPDDDVGFAIVRPVRGKTVAQVTGANTLGLYAPFGVAVTVSGYPGDSDRPIACAGRTLRQNAGQMRFDCDGFTGGTSGGPWVTPAGEVIGVIGGYQRGGDTPSISYSACFGNDVRALFEMVRAKS